MEKIHNLTETGNLDILPGESEAKATNSIRCENKEDEEDDGDFDIPERFTKSGRKRAVPFPLKVSLVIEVESSRQITLWSVIESPLVPCFLSDHYLNIICFMLCLS